MNVRGNQRYQDTGNKIKKVFLELLEKPEPEKITVSEICANAKIHRTTFYGHYEDMNALMQDMVGGMYVQMLDFFVPSEDKPVQPDGFLKMFRFVKEQKAFFLYYFKYSSQRHPDMQMLPGLMREHLSELMDIMSYESEEELLYHQTFFCSGLIAVINRWIEGGCKESPEMMCQILDKEYKPNAVIMDIM